MNSMSALVSAAELPPASSLDGRCETVELYVRGQLPASLSGNLMVAMSRRHKQRP